MPAITIVFGVVLMAIGIGTYAGSEDQPSALLLPIIFGLLGIGLGTGSLFKPNLKMHLMHGAVLIAALGVIVPVVQLVLRMVDMWQEERDRSLTLLAVLLTFALSAGYIYAAVRSFRAARANRKDQPNPPPQAPPPPADPTNPA